MMREKDGEGERWGRRRMGTDKVGDGEGWGWRAIRLGMERGARCRIKVNERTRLNRAKPHIGLSSSHQYKHYLAFTFNGTADDISST